MRILRFIISLFLLLLTVIGGTIIALIFSNDERREALASAKISEKLLDSYGISPILESVGLDPSQILLVPTLGIVAGISFLLAIILWPPKQHAHVVEDKKRQAAAQKNAGEDDDEEEDVNAAAASEMDVRAPIESPKKPKLQLTIPDAPAADAPAENAPPPPPPPGDDGSSSHRQNIDSQEMAKLVHMEQTGLDMENCKVAISSAYPDMTPFLDLLHNEDTAKSIALQVIAILRNQVKIQDKGLSGYQFATFQNKVYELEEQPIGRQYMPADPGSVPEENKKYIGILVNEKSWSEIQKVLRGSRDDWKPFSLRNARETLHKP